MNAETAGRSVVVLFFIDDWTAYRDYIRGKVLRRILSDRRVEVVLASLFRIEDLPDDLKTPRLRLYHVHSPKPTLRARLVYGLAKSLYLVEHPTGTLAIKLRADGYSRGRSVGLRLRLSRLLSWLGLRSHEVVRAQQLSVTRGSFGDVLDRERPDCVLYTCVIPFKAECLKEAKRRRIPLVLAFSFWDQATSKGPLAFEPDEVLSWSEEMSREILQHHHLPATRIHHRGVLYFDQYFQKEGLLERADFCRSLGIDPDKKVILYGMGDSRTLKCNLPFLDKLRGMIASDELGFPCHLLVRVSPKDDYRLYRHLENDQHVTIVFPAGTREAMLDRWLPDSKEDVERVNQIAHSAVVVCVSSTLILDSLCMGKPIVNLGYDAGADRPYYDSVRRFLDYTHARPVMEEGGTWIVRSDAELLEALRAYLADPALHEVERARLLRRIVQFDDGLTHERWAQTVLEIAQRHAARRLSG